MASVVQIRSTQPIPKAVRDSSRYAQHGLALSGAVSCIGCKHCHIATTPPLLPAASTPDEALAKA